MRLATSRGVPLQRTIFEEPHVSLGIFLLKLNPFGLAGSHAEGSGLRLLDLDGVFLRTIAAEWFQRPQAVAVSHGRAFVVDDDEEPGKVLHVIDIQSGDILQRARVDLQGDVSAIYVDGDEIFIASFSASKVVVLRYAGSEA